MESNGKLYQKWWFWGIVIIFVIFIIFIINLAIEQNKLKDTAESIGEGASNFISGIENSQSHINEFSYNYETGEVEYKPSKITLEMYERIKVEMEQKEVVTILGKYENKLDGENTYILDWGDSNMSKGYWIRVIFSKEGNVISKSQIGLK